MSSRGHGHRMDCLCDIGWESSLSCFDGRVSSRISPTSTKFTRTLRNQKSDGVYDKIREELWSKGPLIFQAPFAAPFIHLTPVDDPRNTCLWFPCQLSHSLPHVSLNYYSDQMSSHFSKGKHHFVRPLHVSNEHWNDDPLTLFCWIKMMIQSCHSYSDVSRWTDEYSSLVIHRLIWMHIMFRVQELQPYAIRGQT